MTSVAWQSSSVPTVPRPSGTSTRRTRTHSSLIASTTSAVMPPIDAQLRAGFDANELDHALLPASTLAIPQ